MYALKYVRPCDAGSSRMLDSVVAVVIGGASLYGGTGNVKGTIIGALIIATLETGMVNLGVPSHNRYIAIGMTCARRIDQFFPELVGRESNGGSDPAAERFTKRFGDDGRTTSTWRCGPKRTGLGTTVPSPPSSRWSGGITDDGQIRPGQEVKMEAPSTRCSSGSRPLPGPCPGREPQRTPTLLDARRRPFLGFIRA
jgi:ribose transport system permease protein